MTEQPINRFTMPGEIPAEHGSTRGPGTVVFDGVEHGFPYGEPEDVVAACGGSAVFTVERRVRFLDHLAFKGNVRAAAALVGVSHETAYRKRRQDAAFAALWDAALVHARSYAESQLATRALDGVEVAVWHRGEIAGYVTKHDPRLLLAHLGRLDRQVEQRGDAVVRAERFDELLAQYAGHEEPEGFAEAAREALDWRDRDAAPALPPTRDEWIRARRGDEVGNGPRKTEGARMAEAAELAGEEWDGWHDGALATVEAMLAGEQSEALSSCGRGLGEGSAAPAAADAADPSPSAPDGAPPSPARGEGHSSDLETPADLPYEVKSAPRPFAALNRVNSVNPARFARPSAGWGLRRPAAVFAA